MVKQPKIFCNYIGLASLD